MFVCIDLETTWFDSISDEIIEVALLKFDEQTGEVKETYSTLIKPKKSVPSLIQAITSIEESSLMSAPEFSEIVWEIQNFIGESTIVWHNVRFDTGFLQAKWVSLKENQIVDTFFLANFLYFSEPSLSLEYLAKKFSIIQENAHRAWDDAEATIGLFMQIKADFETLSITQKQIFATLVNFSPDTNIRVLKTIFNLDDTTPLSFEKLQEEILKITEKPLLSSPKYSKKEVESYTEFLSNFKEYTYREGQESLFSLFQETLGQKKKFIIEAPTGIGKTFSYLVPTLQFTVKTGKQVVISTKTKVLQDQITSFDTENLSHILWEKCIITKLKGKKNYFCFQRFFEFLSDNRQLYLEEFSFVSKLVFWLYKTNYWELDELNFYGAEWQLVDNVNVQSWEVLSQKNPFLFSEFYKKIIEKIPFSHVVVVNHNFVFSDIMKPQGSLLKYEHIIFDEAHNLEDIWTESLKVSFNRQSFLVYTEHYLFSWEEKRQVEEILFLLESLEEVFLSLFGISPLAQQMERKTELIPQNLSLDVVFPNLAELNSKLKNLKQSIIKNHTGEFDDGDYLDSLVKLFESFTIPFERERKILYYSYDQKGKLSLFSTYRHIGRFLQENIWQKAPNIYLVSATFSIDEDISFIQKILSLEDFSSVLVPSYFDYTQQARLFIPTNLGDIKRNMEQVITFLWKFIEVVQGQTLVLFTSLLSVKQAYIWVYELLKYQKNIQILAQWVNGGKTKILETFKWEGEKTVVFWTESFWEWVDIPWENLSYLIIHKLPFPVPTDPVFVARGQQYKNSFQEYAVPKTILKLKQGFGRLIRTEKDTGIIILLDNRVIQTDWGKKFFSAFPKDISFDIVSSDKILESISMRKNEL